jgi:diguanylate cyclase (GGDEF)-like protein/PAS domain S-box-containing protein
MNKKNSKYNVLNTSFLDELPVGVFKMNMDKEILFVNKYLCDLTNLDPEMLLGTGLLKYIHHNDIEKLEIFSKIHHDHISKFRFFKAGKDDLWVSCHIVATNDHDSLTPYFLGIVTDISDLKKTQYELEETARIDPLTQLPNRYLFDDILKKCLLQANKKSQTIAVFYVDLDYFKNINDVFGHNAGDSLLKNASQRLREQVGQEDFIVRLGGDEFAIILEDIKNISTISIVAQRLIDSFHIPFYIDNHEIIATLSIGISIYPEEGSTCETIVQHADQALYQAKNSGRNCYKYYNKSMQKKLERYMLIVEQLRVAISNNQFELHYQPQIDALTSRLVGIEALIRWHNPKIGNVSPKEFIIVAEETGLMPHIGAWVIREALSAFQLWYFDNKKMKDIRISINISTSQLNDSSLIKTVTEILKETNIPTDNIYFELTETSVMKKLFDNKSVLQVFLAELGIGISLDDFGTGYSSLTYLKQLPIKELKIDKSFIDDIGKNKNNEEIIKVIIIAESHPYRMTNHNL